jgi:hypothetical protein
MRIYEVTTYEGYLVEDLNQIVKRHDNLIWSIPFPVDIFITEGKQPNLPTKRKVYVITSNLFNETFDKKKRQYPFIQQKLNEFLATKQSNPLDLYGSSDRSFSPGGFFANSVPKLRHAHLSHDISIFYTVTGADPVYIRLYGLFTHDESGIGTPPNRKIQKTVATKLSNQNFS